MIEALPLMFYSLKDMTFRNCLIQLDNTVSKLSDDRRIYQTCFSANQLTERFVNIRQPVQPNTLSVISRNAIPYLIKLIQEDFGLVGANCHQLCSALKERNVYLADLVAKEDSEWVCTSHTDVNYIVITHSWSTQVCCI